MHITAIERQRRRPRANVFLGPLRPLPQPALLAQEPASTPDDPEPAQVDALRQADERHQAQEAALRLLAYRPRSEAELRHRLARRGLASGVVEETVARLREQGLLDDAAFARFWVETREPAALAAAASSAGALGQRHRRGDGRQAIAAVAEEDAALRAAEKKAATSRARTTPSSVAAWATSFSAAASPRSPVAPSEGSGARAAAQSAPSEGVSPSEFSIPCIEFVYRLPRPI